MTDLAVGGKHIVRAIHFPFGDNDGPLECSCGDEMPASEFRGHRKAVQARTGTIESDLVNAPTVWKRSSSTARPARTKPVSR